MSVWARFSRLRPPLSESGFTGLKDFQDSAGARVCDRQALAGIRIGGIFGYAGKRKVGESGMWTSV